MLDNIYRAKLVVIGDATVGKTAITQMFVTDGREFPKNYTMTMGAEVVSKTIPIPGTDDGVELLIYDSAGFELYTDCLSKMWDRPHLMMIVFDVTNRKSLDFVPNWYKIGKSSEWKGPNGNPVSVVLFGNKTDLESRKVCSDKDGEEAAELMRAKYFSGSAKNNQGLEDAFQHLAQEFYNFSTKV